ncbi:MAG: YggS family pyridoxal phosphate-dependent enzyme [Candidatus Omnitrophica bacterium]|nr:YggS family pyridoxal phosphate-dependent enzyme [Candidatus Omnitrophota bacterium]
MSTVHRAVIKDNCEQILGRIAAACARVKRPPQSVTLVCVAKDRTQDEIRQVLAAGVLDIGENRVQEARVHCQEFALPGTRLRPLRVHMVGHLQTNKVPEALRMFDLIHSLDSLHLAEAIERQASGCSKTQDVLIEVNTSNEKGKYGVAPAGLVELSQSVVGMPHIRLQGLMTVAAAVDDPEQARPYFRQLRRLLAGLNELHIVDYELRVLSMGMSNDFEVAIEEGATLLRIGRAFFS